MDDAYFNLRGYGERARPRVSVVVFPTVENVGLTA
jgi:hypothetical protein